MIWGGHTCDGSGAFVAITELTQLWHVKVATKVK